MSLRADLRGSRAYQLLHANIDLWGDLNVRVQFLKDWVKASRREPAGEG